MIVRKTWNYTQPPIFDKYSASKSRLLVVEVASLAINGLKQYFNAAFQLIFASKLLLHCTPQNMSGVT